MSGRRGPREGFQVMCWVPSLVHAMGDQLTDRQKLFCWFIYSLHKQANRFERRADDMFHIANNDFQNILGWKGTVTDYNKNLESLRMIFTIAQAGGYWRIQFSDDTMNFNPPKTKNICSYNWVYLADPHAIAVYYYLTAKFATTTMISDWEEGMDMNEFYKEPVLRRSEYNILKFKKDLYYNDAS